MMRLRACGHNVQRLDFSISLRYFIFVMGYLTEQIADETSRLTQERGRRYFTGGAVERITGDALSVDAIVRGTISYKVQICSLGDFLDYSCTCPYFERDFDPCKHIWAACLAAERNGLLQGAGDNEHFERVPELVPRKAPPKPALVKQAPPTPDWKRQLQPLLAKMQADESQSRFA